MTQKPPTESFITAKGREISYRYGMNPATRKPGLLVLYTLVADPHGQPHAVFREVPVMGKLNKWELAREAGTLEQRADAVERGEPLPDSVEKIDFDYRRS